MIWNPFAWIDAMPKWALAVPESSPIDVAQARLQRQLSDDLEDPRKPGMPPETFRVVDLVALAGKDDVRYENGKHKRTRYPLVDLTKRRVVIVLHQMGVERSETSSRWRHVTAHRVIGPTGNRYRLHPLNVRLVAANRLDRAPWHAISIEVAGNFEGVDGSGNWWQPETMGRGRMGEAQVRACRQEIADICTEVQREHGAHVEAIVPHRIAGHDAKGRPNRPICPGSRVWSTCGEWAGAKLGLAVPGVSFTLRGLPVPNEWHGTFFQHCHRRLER